VRIKQEGSTRARGDVRDLRHPGKGRRQMARPARQLHGTVAACPVSKDLGVKDDYRTAEMTPGEYTWPGAKTGAKTKAATPTPPTRNTSCLGPTVFSTPPAPRRNSRHTRATHYAGRSHALSEDGATLKLNIAEERHDSLFLGTPDNAPTQPGSAQSAQSSGHASHRDGTPRVHPESQPRRRKNRRSASTFPLSQNGALWLHRGEDRKGNG